jgi:5'-phosphate synthase pdxT subunit
MTKIGVLSFQGAVSEHIDIVNRIARDKGINISAIGVKRSSEIEQIDALIIPGGESTTISKLIVNNDLQKVLTRRADEGFPIMGTCAGSVILAKELEEYDKYDLERLNLMSTCVRRNAFGTQRESFEMDLNINGFNEPFHAIFIRAPSITHTWDDCEILNELPEGATFVKQKNLYSITFHPELGKDTRIHNMFIEQCI